MGDSRERPDLPHYYSDDHLWIVLAVCAYLKESGDEAFLEKQVPFYEKDDDGKPLDAGTVLEHLRRAVEFTHSDVGAVSCRLIGPDGVAVTFCTNAGAFGETTGGISILLVTLG